LPISVSGAGVGRENGTVTNSERRISRQRAFCRRRGGQSRLVDRRPRGQALGFGEAFAWQHPHEVFSEHAALSV
jgi:assimilatory nitrate reductase catalytic subunit